jgi:hypothetical protein
MAGSDAWRYGHFAWIICDQVVRYDNNRQDVKNKSSDAGPETAIHHLSHIRFVRNIFITFRLHNIHHDVTPWTSDENSFANSSLNVLLAHRSTVQEGAIIVTYDQDAFLPDQ